MKPSNLFIQQLEIGPIQNYIYFVGDKNTREIAVVDPAWDVDFLCREAKKQNLKIVAVFLTHGHTDHVMGLEQILAKHNVPAYISKHEALIHPIKHKNLKEVENHAKVMVGEVEFEFILTPGHTPGSQCIKAENVLLTGDTLFIDGCGRCDLEGGSAKALYDSLYNVIMKLPDSTIIYSGHNYGDVPFADLAYVKKHNFFLQSNSLKDFLRDCMGISEG